MKFLFSIIVLLSMSVECHAQYGIRRPIYAPSARNYGYAVNRGSNTFFFRGGSNRPAFWVHQNRNFGRSQSHVFQGSRYQGTIYGR